MINLEDDFNSMVMDRHHNQMKSLGEPGHPGSSASTCHECFKVDPGVVEHAAPYQVEDARGHLTSKQFDAMFGNR